MTQATFNKIRKKAPVNQGVKCYLVNGMAIFFVIDQRVLLNFWQSSYFFLDGGGFKCGHPRALYGVNPGLPWMQSMSILCKYKQ